jgi:hypothetical protein
MDTLPPDCRCLDFPVKLLHKQLTAGPLRVGVMQMEQEAP